MSDNHNLKELEKRAFRSTFQDGILDIFLGLVVLQFVISPMLNDRGLGDFWSSFVLLPFYFMAMTLFWAGKKYLITPRLGLVRFGQVRKKRIKTIIIILNGLLLLGLIAGLLAAQAKGQQGLWIFPVTFSALMLVLFSLAAYYLDVIRFFVYGILVSASIPVGELLYQYAGASHHGFPVTFGLCGGIMIAVGTYLFFHFLHKYPGEVQYDERNKM